MQEKTMKTRPGMPVLIAIVVLYAAAIGLMVLGAVMLEAGRSLGALPLILGALWVALGFIPAMGLKIIKPQEALVLTLFGQYVGTLREPGFYHIHPFCTAVNPAAKTRLGQSADVA